MTAQILASRHEVERLYGEISAEAGALRAEGTKPSLATILVGGSGPSMAYARAKEKACGKLGIDFRLREYGETESDAEIVSGIKKLNQDSSVHGIMLELPLPKQIDPFKVASSISHLKDVDGITPMNRGLLFMGKLDLALLPVTPLSCMTLIDGTGVDVKGKEVAIVGRGETVGLPLAVLLIKRSATVTICHSKTKGLREVVRKSDIVVTATGQPGLITTDMLSPGQMVIDAGVSVLPDGRLAGDVDPRASEVVGWLSPVPGGVGSLTVALLLKNLLKAIRIGKENGQDLTIAHNNKP
ncbi:MAG: bifunctional 5,10-methylenetetrahydrofolate dehydrogenase/5,10-methenyltetrahydrofolate cyclohydrolase [Deltaproteobacteria bacterium]|jgi:methylenetetrahydrofolate dehydrogenase (NADP+)/methenyltetrahydrofolate cyclohydrolase|nr:bifunctional 5,10-methylenetetrahydrofolate dehydrogenase/5,10-methenyltetrahydrofolate cyclohydrolase [Deltaproteobacteria bacterium]